MHLAPIRESMLNQFYIRQRLNTSLLLDPAPQVPRSSWAASCPRDMCWALIEKNTEYRIVGPTYLKRLSGKEKRLDASLQATATSVTTSHSRESVPATLQLKIYPKDQTLWLQQNGDLWSGGQNKRFAQRFVSRLDVTWIGLYNSNAKDFCLINHWVSVRLIWQV